MKVLVDFLALVAALLGLFVGLSSPAPGPGHANGLVVAGVVLSLGSSATVFASGNLAAAASVSLDSPFVNATCDRPYVLSCKHEVSKYFWDLFEATCSAAGPDGVDQEEYRANVFKSGCTCALDPNCFVFNIRDSSQEPVNVSFSLDRHVSLSPGASTFNTDVFDSEPLPETSGALKRDLEPSEPGVPCHVPCPEDLVCCSHHCVLNEKDCYLSSSAGIAGGPSSAVSADVYTSVSAGADSSGLAVLEDELTVSPSMDLAGPITSDAQWHGELIPMYICTLKCSPGYFCCFNRCFTSGMFCPCDPCHTELPGEAVTSVSAFTTGPPVVVTTETPSATITAAPASKTASDAQHGDITDQSDQGCLVCIDGFVCCSGTCVHPGHLCPSPPPPVRQHRRGRRGDSIWELPIGTDLPESVAAAVTSSSSSFSASASGTAAAVITATVMPSLETLLTVYKLGAAPIDAVTVTGTTGVTPSSPTVAL